jgi:preprotein translocase subunit SecF
LAAALVSMLTLESTMLTTFSEGTMTAMEQKIMLGTTGGVISALIVATAIYMIVAGTKKLKQLNSEVKNG